MSTDSPIPIEHLTVLRERIANSFNLEDLRLMIFDLGENYDELRGETISAKIQALLEQLNRHNRIPTLLDYLKQHRPNEDWDSYLPAEPEAQSPYKGLRFFTEDDATLFFGREHLTNELINHLRQHCFLTVVGASGSGKSSVVRAGVIPALRRGAIALDDQSSAIWPIHVITPGTEPLKALAATLTRDTESVTATKTLLSDLQADKSSLDLYLYRQMSTKLNSRILLVIDQFEELFTQCDDPEARRLFVENLVTAVSDVNQGRLSLILILRADFYAFAVQVESLRPLLQTKQIIVGAMTHEELRQAIVGPAKQNGWQLQPGLVDIILQDVGKEPGALPLLSHALQETWERRKGREMTLAGYQTAGGVRRAIAQTADTVYASMTPKQQTIARNIFLRLTELGEGTADTRRRATLDELVPEENTFAEEKLILDLLTRKRLIILDKLSLGASSTQIYAEVAHEALIREWPTLQHWLDEDREILRLRHHLAEAATTWKTHQYDPSYLYRGSRLAELEEWLELESINLTELEKAFLKEGVLEQQRETKKQVEQQRQEGQLKYERRLKRALFISTMLLLIMVVFAIFQNRKLDEQRQIARASLLIIQSQQLFQSKSLTEDEKKEHKTVALLLALEGIYLTSELKETESIVIEAETYFRKLLIDMEAIPTTVLNGSNDNVYRNLALSNDGHLLAAVGTDQLVYLWDLGNSEEFPIVLFPLNSISRDLVFSPNNRWLATANGDSTVSLFDLENPEVNPLILDHIDDVGKVEFSPDSKRLATVSFDGSVRLWDIDNLSSPPLILQGQEVRAIVFRQDAQRLYTLSRDKTIRIWDITNSQPSSSVLVQLNDILQNDNISFGVFAADQKRLIISTYEEGFPIFNFYVIDFTDAGTHNIVYQRSMPVSEMAFSPNGRWLAIRPQNSVSQFYMWDMSNPKPALLQYSHWFNNGISFSKDNRWLATSGEGIILWPNYLEGLTQAACTQTKRNLTENEWNQYFPGERYRQTCQESR